MNAAIPVMIGLGRLVNFIIRDEQCRRLVVTPKREQWLAWNQDTRDLVVLRPWRGKGELVPPRDARRHRAFHGAEPEQARPMELPAPSRGVRAVGLIEAVTYLAEGIRSPSKGPHHWIHQFGDRGERGHGSASPDKVSRFPDKLFPALCVSAAGDIIIVRRSENSYTVNEWIYG